MNTRSVRHSPAGRRTGVCGSGEEEGGNHHLEQGEEDIWERFADHHCSRERAEQPLCVAGREDGRDRVGQRLHHPCFQHLHGRVSGRDSARKDARSNRQLGVGALLWS